MNDDDNLKTGSVDCETHENSIHCPHILHDSKHCITF